jgi:hypothetical protein
LRYSPGINLETIACPLCRAHGVSEFSTDKRRNYLRCTVCSLVFVPSSQFLSAEDEKKRYDLHRNSPDNADYRRFLGRLFIPLKQRLAPGSSGLDFGSGPEPTLSRMFEEAGHSMMIFDQYYEHAPAALDLQYDFITASEVVEHLREPRKELDRLWACLQCGGWLGIMTKFAAEPAAFPRWYYKNDLTHVCFFSPAAFAWLAAAWNADLIIPDDDVVLFRKNRADKSAG